MYQCFFPPSELDFLPSEIMTIDDVLNNSWMCYSKALELENRDLERDNLQRRLGNICNELGSYFMKKARGILYVDISYLP